MTLLLLFAACAVVIAYCAGVHHGETTAPEPVDPDEPNPLDVAPRTYIGGWLPRPRAADARLQSAVRGSTPTGLPRRKARRTR